MTPTNDAAKSTAGQPSAVAVIPARGGSKRVPHKNIQSISGQPLISWAILAALESGAFDQVVVSTNDPEIAAVAADWGAVVPFVRPAALSGDHAPTAPVIVHALTELAKLGMDYAYACCVYPAAIFVSPEDYLKSRQLLDKSAERPYVVTIVGYPHPIQRALKVDQNSNITFVDSSHAYTRTQDLPERWHDAGQFYWGRTDAWLDSLPILENAVGYPLRSWQVQDIDSEEDLERARKLHALQLAERHDPNVLGS